MNGKRRNIGDESAVHWFLQFELNEFPTLHPTKLAEWSRWSMKPEHLAEVQRIARLWKTLDLVLPELARPSLADSDE
jgi:ferric-dicitrate binding protein FerR (iron transport regulator)